MKRPILAVLVLCCATAAQAAAPDAAGLIRKAMDHWRGASSRSTMTMVIHRPDWERAMTMQSWTLGDEHSLVRVTAPPKDAGNGTLLLNQNLWTYTPRINRVVKIPSSMMSQSWMGSDLSNKDISKSTDIIDQYDHTLVETRRDGDHTVWEIDSVPHEEAAVVWGKEVLFIRDDFVLLEQQFWDQDGELVKTFRSSDIRELGGRMVATVMRMQEVEKPGQWTEIRVEDIEFEVNLPDSLFTLSNLRNPRQ